VCPPRSTSRRSSCHFDEDAGEHGEDAADSDEEKSEEEINKEKKERRNSTIEDYSDGYLPGVHDNHGMEAENNRKEDGNPSQSERGKKRKEYKFE